MSQARVIVKLDLPSKLDTQARILGAAKIVNQEVNAGMRGIGGEFFRKFASERLGGAPGIKVRRKIARSRRKRGQPALPSRAKAIGFFGKIRRLGRLEGKELNMGTSNPQALAQEFGATISPGKKMFLKRREGRGKGKVFAVTGTVRLKPKLGFMTTWDGFSGAYDARVKGIWDRIEKRM